MGEKTEAETYFQGLLFENDRGQTWERLTPDIDAMPANPQAIQEELRSTLISLTNMIRQEQADTWSDLELIRESNTDWRSRNDKVVELLKERVALRKAIMESMVSISSCGLRVRVFNNDSEPTREEIFAINYCDYDIEADELVGFPGNVRFQPEAIVVGMPKQQTNA